MAANSRLRLADMQANPSEFSIPADPKLLAEGWIRRHLVDPLRAKESIELYTSLGYEVKAQTLTPADFGPQCGKCALVACGACVVIYTRKKGSAERARATRPGQAQR